MRIELQMALDSKDSDIEQLRSLLNSFNVQSLDSASMSSGPEMDTDEALAGTEFCAFLNFHIFSQITNNLSSQPFLYSLFTFLFVFWILSCHPLLYPLSFGHILNATLDLSPFISEPEHTGDLHGVQCINL